MKKIILTAVMAFTLLYVGLIDFSYAEDIEKGISELTGAEIAEENTPIILAQRNIDQNEDDLDEKDREDDVVENEKVEVQKEDEPDDDDEKVEVGVEGVERRRIRERR
jgi:hypothetical protein